jgi:hypothetical protein
MNTSTVPSLQIVSGGQTGVDRAALDAAMQLGVPAGGWCPEGRMAEDGVIPDRYPLRELKGGGYPERTRKNVVNSDGTVIIYFEVISDGTELTRRYCVTESKPHLLIDGTKVNEAEAAKQIRRFVQQYGIGTLNVAGPRAGKNDKAYHYTHDALVKFLTG